MGARYFADTFYWIALVHPKDAWHGRVIAWAASHPSADLVTTTEVLSEVLNWFATKGPAGRALSGECVCHAQSGCQGPRCPPLGKRVPRGWQPTAVHSWFIRHHCKPAEPVRHQDACALPARRCMPPRTPAVIRAPCPSRPKNARRETLVASFSA